MNLPFAHPWMLAPAGGLALAALLMGLWAQTRPGLGVRVVGQKPFRLGLGLALVLAGLGLGLAEPRWGAPERPRLAVHVLLDASRSMLAEDCGGRSRWSAACGALDRLWSTPQPELRYSLDLLTGDSVPLVAPGEDASLLRDTLRAVQPGAIGSQGTSLGRGIPMALSQVEAGEPAVLLLLSDGEETWEREDEARSRALEALKKAKVPLLALVLGGTDPTALPAQAAGQAPGPQAAGQAPGPQAAPSHPSEPARTAARPDFIKALAEASGGRLVASPGELPALFKGLAHGTLPLPPGRSSVPAHPEVGAWVALAGLLLWLAGAGGPLRAWRMGLALLFLLGAGAPAARAALPLPQSVKAWLAQRALDGGDLAGARKWRPEGRKPDHRLLAALIDLRSQEPAKALETLAPLTGQGAPRPLPAWRVPALLLAARAQVALGKPHEALTLLERLLKEAPGRAEAVHDLQSLIRDLNPPPPDPRKPPPPPPPRPSQGARQDEIEGIQQRLPQPQRPPAGVKDQ